jgi:hypothetical protein
MVTCNKRGRFVKHIENTVRKYEKIMSLRNVTSRILLKCTLMESGSFSGLVLEICLRDTTGRS